MGLIIIESFEKVPMLERRSLTEKLHSIVVSVIDVGKFSYRCFSNVVMTCQCLFGCDAILPYGADCSCSLQLLLSKKPLLAYLQKLYPPKVKVLKCL